MSPEARAMIKDLDDLETIAPPRLLDGPALVLATALAAPRRRVYEATDPSNLYALANLLHNSYPAEPRPFRCGHTCHYITPAARHILREAEPQLVCLWCLTETVHSVLERDLYPAFTADWEFGSDDRDHGAIARYYVSLLELHYELNARAGATLLAKLTEADRRALIYFLWDQLSTFNTEAWLSEDGELSLLQGANQAVRHLQRAKHTYDRDHYELATLLGLDLTESEYGR